MGSFDPVFLAVVLGSLSLLPLLVVAATAFLKISTVLLLVRNALGVQQIPPNLAIYGVSMILALFVMSPTLIGMSDALKGAGRTDDIQTWIARGKEASEPLRTFLNKYARPDQKTLFFKTAQRMLPEKDKAALNENDFVILLPAFVTSELTAAFEIGFLLYLPFVIIDLLVSNVLLALGMMMVSPMTISLPLKLLLFVSIDGWSRLLHGLVLGYV
jgi:type III secretion protein R